MNNVEHTREWFQANKQQFEYKLLDRCVNCGGSSHELHHIVPLALGGTNNDSNIIQLCSPCHGLVHGKRIKQDISHLTKLGLERARANGSQIGRKTGSTIVTKKSIEMKAKIIKLSKSFNGTLSDKEVLELLDIDRTTYYRYKKQIKEQQATE